MIKTEISKALHDSHYEQSLISFAKVRGEEGETARTRKAIFPLTRVFFTYTLI